MAINALPYFSRKGAGFLPLEAMQDFITAINGLIKEHNEMPVDKSTNIARRKILRKIQAVAKKIEYGYPPSSFASSPDYQTITTALFNDIKEAYRQAGRSTLVVLKEKISPLTTVIANMTQDKANKLFELLQNQQLGKLTTLYDPNDKSKEAEDFRLFIKNHDITLLHQGNSVNFKIVNTDTNKTAVLKIDNRMNRKRNVEAHLTNQSPQHFSPINAERQVFGLQNGQKICRTLVATQYFTKGSLLQHSKNNQEKAKDAGALFEQMATALLDIQKANCLFPDAKLTNWLVDENNRLQIADTKSFLFTNEQGQCGKSLNGESSLLTTEEFKPPEFQHYLFRVK